MNFAEKLKDARKATGMSQEALAEKLGVSRQAVTKWETNKGLPDIDNLIVISNLFKISVDELLSSEKESAVCRGYLYESRTEYDIDGKKKYDMNLGGASALKVFGTDGEKIIAHLASNEIQSLKEDFKVKIDDIRGRIDVDVKRKNQMTEAKAKENLTIELFLPIKYLAHIEINCNCAHAILSNLVCEKIELCGKISQCDIESIEGELEIDCNVDMALSLNNLTGELQLNQVSSTSKICVPEDFRFKSVARGIKTSISYEIDGVLTEDFSNPEAENVIELNGLKSELLIYRTKG